MNFFREAKLKNFLLNAQKYQNGIWMRNEEWMNALNSFYVFQLARFQKRNLFYFATVFIDVSRVSSCSSSREEGYCHSYEIEIVIWYIWQNEQKRKRKKLAIKWIMQFMQLWILLQFAKISFSPEIKQIS